MSMVINTNMSALNTYNQLNKNNSLMNSSLEKLSSGYRINSAADDAAGLAISEKMRGQIRGLDQASANAQDAISLTQTAEGALDESTSILQRMRELSVQASTDTLTEDDRNAVQDEMTQLTSELNRIGNTTEFNTKNLLKGDGKVSLASTKLVTDGNLGTGTGNTAGVTNYTQATQSVTLTAGAAAADTASFTINGQQLKVSFTASTSNGGTIAGDNTGYNVTANSADVAIDATSTVATTADGLASALQQMIDANSTLKGNYTAVSDGVSKLTITAVKTDDGGTLDGSKGNIAAASETGTIAWGATDGAASVGTTTYTQATKEIDFSSLETGTATTTDANLKALVGTGMTINGTQIEFYNADDGAYTGDAIGVNISTALAEGTDANKADELVKNIVTQVGTKIDGVVLSQDTTTDTLVITADSDHLGEAGNSLSVKDGGVQEAFKATFQIGANTGQTMSLSINDMRSQALQVSSTTSGGSVTVKDNDGNDVTASYKAVSEVTDGTSDDNTEYALDLSTADKATAAISVIDAATSAVSSERSKLGAVQNRLEHTINNLTTSSENLTSAESRIRDVDMASEMAEYTKLSTLNQAATAMLAQANQLPQQVLSLLK
ncbi:flagellin [Sporomusa sp.]|uniref:flagellin N-terminal helical domain-containing protein n=1 Tax=Sporomusa sp. TaxID=2078658 RepID=UPI002CF953DC|nr:flagellin [Sporomusa sp.]HWR44472.1 flagellin [Sporomusa sp.]